MGMVCLVGVALWCDSGGFGRGGWGCCSQPQQTDGVDGSGWRGAPILASGLSNWQDKAKAILCGPLDLKSTRSRRHKPLTASSLAWLLSQPIEKAIGCRESLVQMQANQVALGLYHQRSRTVALIGDNLPGK